MASSSSSSSSSLSSAELASISVELQRDVSRQLLTRLPAPTDVWKQFLWVCESTRVPSKLDSIRSKLLAFAHHHHLDAAVDAIGNVRLRRAATNAALANATSIVLQSHIDMVCSSTSGTFDFDTTPITPQVGEDGDWMNAAGGTTLGADDGIGVAASLALLADKATQTGPLEALFTVDEETTMCGAEFIAGPPFLQSQICINVDSEQASEVCVGCAGGFEKQLFLPVTFIPVPLSSSASASLLHLTISNLRGGHTGTDIDKGRASALLVLARIIDSVLHRSCNSSSIECSLVKESDTLIHLVEMKGGNAVNAIPRYASATLYVASNAVGVQQQLTDSFARIQQEFAHIETADRDETTSKLTTATPKSSMKLAFDAPTAASSSSHSPSTCLSVVDTRRVIGLMLKLPHGVLKMSQTLAGEVDTSISFSLVELKETAESNSSSSSASSEFMAHLFCRSSFNDEMEAENRRLEELAVQFGCRTSGKVNPFPGWKPNPASVALKYVVETHAQLFEGQTPRVYSVHAGLECGLLMGKYPELDCVSIGPTIEHAHSPEERLAVKTVAPFYEWLKATVVRIGEATAKVSSK